MQTVGEEEEAKKICWPMPKSKSNIYKLHADFENSMKYGL